MANTSRKYANTLVYRAGAQLTEETEITITRDFANKPIKTVARGFAGSVKGGPVMRVKIRSAVPCAGVEYDPGPDGESADPVEFTFIRGSQQMTTKFIVETDETSHRVDDESTLNFDLIGPLAQWQAL